MSLKSWFKSLSFLGHGAIIVLVIILYNLLFYALFKSFNIPSEVRWIIIILGAVIIWGFIAQIYKHTFFWEKFTKDLKFLYFAIPLFITLISISTFSMIIELEESKQLNAIWIGLGTILVSSLIFSLFIFLIRKLLLSEWLTNKPSWFQWGFSFGASFCLLLALIFLAMFFFIPNNDPSFGLFDMVIILLISFIGMFIFGVIFGLINNVIIKRIVKSV